MLGVVNQVNPKAVVWTPPCGMLCGREDEMIGTARIANQHRYSTRSTGVQQQGAVNEDTSSTSKYGEPMKLNKAAAGSSSRPPAQEYTRSSSRQ